MSSLPPSPPWPPDVPPRPDLAPPPGPSPTPRRRTRWPAVVAIVLTVGLVTTAVGVGSRSVRTSSSTASLPHGAHRFLAKAPDGSPERWNPCEPIHYEVNLANAPPGGMDDVRAAIERASAATGIRFVFDGTTSRTADQQYSRVFQSGVPGEPRYLPLLIDWVPHEHFHFVVQAHDAVAYGLPWSGDGALAFEYVSGVIAIDAGAHLPTGFGERFSDGVVLMHELGHVLGLAHVGDADEIMWSPDVKGGAKVPDLLQTDWGPGDAEGLRDVGREAGCLAPQH